MVPWDALTRVVPWDALTQVVLWDALTRVVPWDALTQLLGRYVRYTPRNMQALAILGFWEGVKC